MKNVSLSPLSFLIGKWDVTMTHSALPAPLSWVDSFEWIDNSFILWRWQGKNEVPQAISIIGRNENTSGDLYTMLYHDTRGVSRKMEMSFENNIWKYIRMDEEFSQRFEGIVRNENNLIEGNGDTSTDQGNSWTHDYSITYKRKK